MPRPLYRVRRHCQRCGKSMILPPSWSSRQFCSSACYWASLTGKPHLPIEDRFWLKVQKTESCWLWQGGTAGFGYGTLCVGSHLDNSLQRIPAHRFSWQLHYGPIPEGREVCHNCPTGDNPSCVNPAHLFLDSHKGNMLDAQAKGRMPRGERNGQAKLSEEDVMEIRRLRLEERVRVGVLAERFQVNRHTIYKIVTGKRWKHVK